MKKNKKFVRKSNKDLTIEYKKTFFKLLFKWGTIVSLIVGCFIGIGYLFCVLVESNKEVIDSFCLLFLTGFWFAVSAWYVTLPLSLVWFFRQNYKWVEGLSDSEVKYFETNKEELFGQELWLFIKSLWIINYLTMWKLVIYYFSIVEEGSPMHALLFSFGLALVFSAIAMWFSFCGLKLGEDLSGDGENR